MIRTLTRDVEFEQFRLARSDKVKGAAGDGREPTDGLKSDSVLLPLDDDATRGNVPLVVTRRWVAVADANEFDVSTLDDDVLLREIY